MHKIDGSGHASGQFVSEDAATGRPPTVVTPEWLNAVQGELVELVTAAGFALDKNNSVQVLAALKLIFGDGPGAVAFFARSTAPVGYLKANGAAVSRTAYSALFASVGTTFGAGDGATTFNLPDLRGEFLRGWDDGRGVDTGRVFGSAQLATRIRAFLADQALNDTDSPAAFTAVLGIVSGQQDQFGLAPQSTDRAAGGGQWAEPIDDNVSWGGRGSNGGSGAKNSFFTVRPRNLAFLACIKF